MGRKQDRYLTDRLRLIRVLDVYVFGTIAQIIKTYNGFSVVVKPPRVKKRDRKISVMEEPSPLLTPNPQKGLLTFRMQIKTLSALIIMDEYSMATAVTTKL